MTEIFQNIRQLYFFSSPCPDLAEHIEFFSESSPEATRDFTHGHNFSVKMFASFTPTFWFNLGASYELQIGGRQYHVPAAKDILVVRDGIIERFNSPSDHIFSIKFFPGALEAIFGIDQSKMINQPVDLAQIMSSATINKIKEKKSFRDKVNFLEQYFLSEISKKKKRDHYIRFVSDTIAVYESENMKYNLNELAEKLFTSSKTINRYFNRVIGTSPKNYFSIFRARVALTEYVADKKKFDPTVFGYYDSSHFYKEIHQFTDQRLSEI